LAQEHQLAVFPPFPITSSPLYPIMTSYGSHGTYYLNERQVPASTGARLVRQDQGQAGESLKQQGPRTVRLPLTQKALTLIGLAVLICLVALPVSDAGMLLHDFNYVFWVGQALPATVIISLAALIVIYFLWSVSMGQQGVENMNIHDGVTIVSTFICLLGVVLVLTSLALYWNGYQVTSALMYNCKGSAVSRDVRQSYLGLLALRQSPACATKFSIEECAGYANAAPPAFANYFLSLESQYRCSGFCYTNPPAATVAPVSQTNSSVLQVAGKHVSGFLGKEQAGVLGKEAAERIHREFALPPALFSQNPYKTSCDGAAARNLTFMALGISHVWWMIGVVLIGLSGVVGFGEWFCCARKIK